MRAASSAAVGGSGAGVSVRTTVGSDTRSSFGYVIGPALDGSVSVRQRPRLARSLGCAFDQLLRLLDDEKVEAQLVRTGYALVHNAQLVLV
jgi:hypothetical protein